MQIFFLVDTYDQKKKKSEKSELKAVSSPPLLLYYYYSSKYLSARKQFVHDRNSNAWYLRSIRTNLVSHGYTMNLNIHQSMRMHSFVLDKRTSTLYGPPVAPTRDSSPNF